VVSAKFLIPQLPSGIESAMAAIADSIVEAYCGIPLEFWSVVEQSRQKFMAQSPKND
jgi:hypothetical protein